MSGTDDVAATGLSHSLLPMHAFILLHCPGVHSFQY